MSDVDALTQVTSNLAEGGRPYIAVVANRADAAAAGLSAVALGSFVASAMQPQAAGSVVIDEKTLTVYLATENPPTTVDELRALEVPTRSGRCVSTPSRPSSRSTAPRP